MVSNSSELKAPKFTVIICIVEILSEVLTTGEWMIDNNQRSEQIALTQRVRDVVCDVRSYLLTILI
ncbi:MAG: hypothetical protein K2Z81_26990 [Cyanobacteria bacterium]|nr:hypothetical protein [Cyanobacteriota bacterium]